MPAQPKLITAKIVQASGRENRMKSFLMSIYTAALIGIGFYARGVCVLPVVIQHANDIQVAAETQDAFTKLAQHLNKGVR